PGGGVDRVPGDRAVRQRGGVAPAAKRRRQTRHERAGLPRRPRPARARRPPPRTPAPNGLFYGGGLDLLGRQALAALIVHVLSFVVAAGLAFAIEKTIGFRAKGETGGGG